MTDQYPQPGPDDFAAARLLVDEAARECPPQLHGLRFRIDPIDDADLETRRVAAEMACETKWREYCQALRNKLGTAWLVALLGWALFAVAAVGWMEAR